MQTTASSLRATTFEDFSTTLPGRIVLGLAATVAVALAAHVSIPLWFTPVPLIMTPLAVLGVGLAFGPVGGFMVMMAYLAEGAMGLPVFSPGGLGGVAQMCGPTGGYLMSYPLVAAIAGGLTRALPIPRFLAALIGCTAAVAVLFALGATWLAHIVPALSAKAVWIEAVAPFLPGEAVKVLAASGIYSTLQRARRA